MTLTLAAKTSKWQFLEIWLQYRNHSLQCFQMSAARCTQHLFTGMAQPDAFNRNGTLYVMSECDAPNDAYPNCQSLLVEMTRHSTSKQLKWLVMKRDQTIWAEKPLCIQEITKPPTHAGLMNHISLQRDHRNQSHMLTQSRGQCITYHISPQGLRVLCCFRV